MPRTLKPVNIKHLLLKYIYHWPLFVLFLTLFIGAALLFVKYTPSTYEVLASISVKDTKKTAEEKSALQELNQAERSKLAESEIEVISSRRLITQVVKDLNLWITYTYKDKFATRELYKDSPVKFVTSKTDVEKEHFKILLSQDGFVVKADSAVDKRYRYGQLVEKSWTLEKTKYIHQFINKEIEISLTDLHKASEFYQSALNVSLLNKLAPTITLSINEKVTQRGQDFLNKLIDDYINSSTNEKNNNSITSVSFIDEKLDSLRRELNISEDKVENYKSGNGLTNIASESQVFLDNARVNDAKLNDINVQINIIRGIENYISAPQNLNNVPSTIGIGDNNLSTLIDRLSQLQLEKAKLLANTPESNPVFDQINSQIKITRNAISSTVKTLKSTLLATRRELQNFDAKFQNSIRQIPGQERQTITLQRQQKANEDLYNYLLQRRAALSLSYTATLSDARIIDNAYVGRKIWPQKIPVVAIALFLGFMVPLVIIYLRTMIGNKVLTKEDIELAINDPVFAQLPKDSEYTDGLINPAINNAISENFRSLRTKLYYVNKDLEKGRVILVTSSTAGEGKSFLSANLGTSLSFLGRKVVLLEMDFRKPKLAKLFGKNTTNTGLTDYLTNKNLPLGTIIQKSESYNNLDIISAGGQVDNPAELLADLKLKNLIDELKRTYDDIIIDSPPFQLVTDAMIIGRVADFTLYVIRQGVTDKDQLGFVQDVLSQKELPDVKIVFNGVAQGKFGYGKRNHNSYYIERRKMTFRRFKEGFFSRL